MLDDRGRNLRVEEKHGRGRFLNPTVFSPMPRWVLTMESTDSPLVCSDNCGQRNGYTNLGSHENPWWVAAKCRRPTFMWLKAQGDTVLNFFVGGPLHELAYATSTLLTDTALHSLITEYAWTPETRKSQATGRIARVWSHIPTQVPGSVTHAAGNDPAIQGGTVMTDQTTQESQATEAEATSIDTSGLEAEREKLKVSRQKVADASNGKLTVAKVYRLERGAGSRNTQEEVDAYNEALRVLAAQASEAQAAANTEGTAGSTDPS